MDAGAKPDKLCAWVAGGALVSPVQEDDLAFNIGGRTTEGVMAFLASKHINNIKSETGGFFSCTLNLNMRTWECDIEPTGFELNTVRAHPRLSTKEEIINSMDTLQPIPQVALKILRLINEDNYDVTVLTEEMRKDQILSALTIKLCNSVYVSSLKKIESMDHALVYLGQKKLVKFVLSATIKSFFDQAGMGYSLCKGGIYHHAVGTALIAEEIARTTKKAEPALAYTGGLLHDIGKVVLDQHIQAGSPLFYRQLSEEGKDSSEVEKTVFGLDHQEVGTILAGQWSFPTSLIEVVKHHHQPENALQYTNLVHIIYLADLLMSRFNVALEVERMETTALAERLKTLGFSIDAFSDIVNMIPAKALEYSSKR